jgi:hypothetical protein
LSTKPRLQALYLVVITDSKHNLWVPLPPAALENGPARLLLECLNLK